MSRRLKPKQIIHVERFLADAEDIHKRLVAYTGDLRTTSPHYQALEKVHSELIAAIKVVTGEDAPWVHRSSTGPSGWLDR